MVISPEVSWRVDFHHSGHPRMKQLPLCVTVAEISGKFLMDVTSEEEMCAEVGGAGNGWLVGKIGRCDSLLFWRLLEVWEVWGLGIFDRGMFVPQVPHPLPWSDLRISRIPSDRPIDKKRPCYVSWWTARLEMWLACTSTFGYPEVSENRIPKSLMVNWLIIIVPD